MRIKDLPPNADMEARMTSEEIVARGQRARNLLESDVYQEALYDIRDSHLVRLQLMTQWDEQAVRREFELVLASNFIDAKLSHWADQATRILRDGSNE